MSGTSPSRPPQHRTRFDTFMVQLCRRFFVTAYSKLAVTYKREFLEGKPEQPVAPVDEPTPFYHFGQPVCERAHESNGHGMPMNHVVTLRNRENITSFSSVDKLLTDCCSHGRLRIRLVSARPTGGVHVRQRPPQDEALLSLRRHLRCRLAGRR